MGLQKYSSSYVIFVSCAPPFFANPKEKEHENLADFWIQRRTSFALQNLHQQSPIFLWA